VRVPRVYCPGLRVGTNILDEEEAHHVTRVLRLGAGDEVALFDGGGREAQGRIETVTRVQTAVAVESITEHPFDLRLRLTLAVAVTKAQRHSYLIEKCTELGVAGLWSIVTGRSVTQPADAAIEKWSRRAIEACKQSGRAWVPSIESPQPLDRAIARRGEFEAAFTAAPAAPLPMHAAIAALPPDSRLLVFVGPEGGWTPAELAAFTSGGIASVALSPTVLRGETAAVAVCAAVALASCPRPTAS